MSKISLVQSRKAEEKVNKLQGRIKTLRSGDFYTPPAYTAGVDFLNYNSADVFALYDSLVTAYPDYITKELVANEITGLPIYKYTFNPQKPEITRDTTMTTDIPHFFIVSGVHAMEKAGWWALYHNMKLICEEWQNNEILEDLRWNVKFTVMPLVNVYGLDNQETDPVVADGKKNANGIDINRNFPIGFEVLYDPSHYGYGGEEPLTEIESQAIADFLQNGNVDFYADLHNFGSNSNPNYFMWNIGGDKTNINLSQSFVSSISLKWKKENADFPQGDDVFFGYSSPGVGGSTPPYINSLGITGGIFEITDSLDFISEPQYSNKSITFGIEAQLNWLYMAYKNLTN